MSNFIETQNLRIYCVEIFLLFINTCTVVPFVLLLITELYENTRCYR